MTQLTQGSDMEEQLRKDLDDWAVRHMIQVPARAMQQGCDKELRAIIEDYKQRSIDRTEKQARLDEAASVTVLPDGTVWSLQGEGQPLDRRIAELEQQLSPTTIEDKGGQES